jgi:hypothetical protein
MDSFGCHGSPIIGAGLVLQRNSDAGWHPTRERAPKSSVCFERHILIEKLAGW